MKTETNSNKYQDKIKRIRTMIYEIPTDSPESDGTFEWNKTTLIIVEIEANNEKGIGYTYGHRSISEVIQNPFAKLLENSNPMDIPLLWDKLLNAARNMGSRGIAASAIAAIDIALWDLKAKIMKT